MPSRILDHEQRLASAFDQQAARFERAPVQTDRAALARLVRFMDLAPNSLVLDTGCGPGLVAEALLEAGHRVVGIDLSIEMIDRARARCQHFGDRARFVQVAPGHASATDVASQAFDAAVSRSVLHHVPDPLAFLNRQCGRLKPGGIAVLSDHTTDTDPHRAAWHQGIEHARDHTHTACLTHGGIVDLFASGGLVSIRSTEESFTLDFDEWFDRGSPIEEKPPVRARLLDGTGARGFQPVLSPDGAIVIHCWRTLVRGVVPASFLDQ